MRLLRHIAYIAPALSVCGLLALRIVDAALPATFAAPPALLEPALTAPPDLPHGGFTDAARAQPPLLLAQTDDAFAITPLQTQAMVSAGEFLPDYTLGMVESSTGNISISTFIAFGGFLASEPMVTLLGDESPFTLVLTGGMIADNASVLDNYAEIEAANVAIGNPFAVDEMTVRTTLTLEGDTMTASLVFTVAENEFPTLRTDETFLSLDEDAAVSDWTVAELGDVSGIEVNSSIEIIEETQGLFSQTPQVTLTTAEPGATTRKVVLTGGVLAPDAHGSWTAAVHLFNAENRVSAQTRRTFPLTISVRALNDLPTINIIRPTLVVLENTDTFVDSPTASFGTLALVEDPEGTPFSNVDVNVINARSTPSGLFTMRAIAGVQRGLQVGALAQMLADGTQGGFWITVIRAFPLEDTHGVWTATVGVTVSGDEVGSFVATISVRNVPTEPIELLDAVTVFNWQERSGDLPDFTVATVDGTSQDGFTASAVGSDPTLYSPRAGSTTPTAVLRGEGEELRTLVLTGGRWLLEAPLTMTLEVSAGGESSTSVLLTVTIRPSTGPVVADGFVLEHTVSRHDRNGNDFVLGSVSGDDNVMFNLEGATSMPAGLFSVAPTVATEFSTFYTLTLAGGTLGAARGALQAGDEGLWMAMLVANDDNGRTELGVVTITVLPDILSVGITPRSLSLRVTENTGDEPRRALLFEFRVATLEGISRQTFPSLAYSVANVQSTPEGVLERTPVLARSNMTPGVQDETAIGLLGLRNMTLAPGVPGEWTATLEVHPFGTAAAQPIEVGVMTISVVEAGANAEPVVTGPAAAGRDGSAASVQAVTEGSGAVPAVVIATVSDAENDPLTVELFDRGPFNVFATAPTVSLRSVAGSDSDYEVVMYGGELTDNGNGFWAGHLFVGDGVAGVLDFNVFITVGGVDTPPMLVTSFLPTVVSIDEDSPVPRVVLASIIDVDSGGSGVFTNTMSAPQGLFSTAPRARMMGNDGTTSAREFVLTGGVLAENLFGEWTATALMHDGVSTLSVGVLTISVHAVNDPPEILALEPSIDVSEDSPVPDFTVAEVQDPEGDAIEAVLGSTASDPPNLFATPPGLSITEVQGGSTSAVVLSGGVLTEDANGVWSATVSVGDGNGGTVTTRATIRVTPVNDPPEFLASERSVDVSEGSPVPDFTVAVVQDPDGDAIAAVLGSTASTPPNLFATPPGLSITEREDGSSAVVLSGGVLTENANGVWSATVSVGDGNGGTVTTEVTIRVLPANGPPEFLASDLSVDVFEDDSVPDFTVAVVQDPDGDAIEAVLGSTVSDPPNLFAAPPGLSITEREGGSTSAVVLSGGILTENANGVWSAAVSVGDGNGETVTTEVTIRVSPVNDPPVFGSVVGSGRLTVVEDAPLSDLTIAEVRDVDGNPPSDSASLRDHGPAGFFATNPGFRFDSRGGALYAVVMTGWSLSADVNGVWTAMVSVGGRNNIPVTLSVTPMDDPPQASNTVLAHSVDEDTEDVPAYTLATIRQVDRDSAGMLGGGLQAVSLFPGPDTILTGAAVSLADTGVEGRYALVLHGATLMEDANGEWMVSVQVLNTRSAPEVRRVGWSVTIAVRPVNDALQVSDRRLSHRVQTGDEELTLATVRDVDGDDLTGALEGATSMPAGLFSTAPTLTVAGSGVSQDLVLRGGELADEDAAGIWMATVSVGDGVGSPVSVGVATLMVDPRNDTPVVVAGPLSVTASAPGVLTLATVRDEDSTQLTLILRGAGSEPPDLFSTPPTVSLTPDVASVMAGDELALTVDVGEFMDDVNGVWTATMWLSDGELTARVGVASVVVLGDLVLNDIESENRAFTSAEATLTVDARGVETRVRGLSCPSGGCTLTAYTCTPTPANVGDLDACSTMAATDLEAGSRTVHWRMEQNGEAYLISQQYRVLPLLQFGSGRPFRVSMGTTVTLGIPLVAYGEVPEEVSATISGMGVGVNGDADEHTVDFGGAVTSIMLAATLTLAADAEEGVAYSLEIPRDQFSGHSFPNNTASVIVVSVMVDGDVAASRVTATLFYPQSTSPRIIFGDEVRAIVAVDADEPTLLLETTEPLITDISARIGATVLPAMYYASTGVIRLPGEAASGGLTLEFYTSDEAEYANAVWPIVIADDSAMVRDLRGVADTDMDGVPDSVADDDNEVLRVSGGGDLRSGAGQTLRLGAHMLSRGATTLAEFRSFEARLDDGTTGVAAGIDISEPPPGYISGSGIFGYRVLLPRGHADAVVVIPLGAPLVSGATLYQYDDKDEDATGWLPFIPDNANRAYSAPSPCPAPIPEADLGWGEGLTAGNECLLLITRDGGEYDRDMQANGIVVDPLALGAPPSSGGGGGGSAIGLGALLPMLLLAAAAQRRRRR